MSTAMVTTVKNELRASGVAFPDEWYEQCVGWIQENYTGRAPITSVHLKGEVMSQWIDTNLLDLKSASLPPNLAAQKMVVLRGPHVLQVNYVEDIGESAYSQWNKLKKLTNENTNVSGENNEYKPTWEPKPRRCIYLTMTDGTQKVYGMELVPIRALNVEMKPGCKIAIKGPVNCRRGVFHLKPENIVSIQGEVEGLVETNNMEQVLKRKLNDDENEPKGPPLPRPTYKRPPSPPNSRKPKGVSASFSSSTQISSSQKNPSSTYSNQYSNNYGSSNNHSSGGGTSSSNNWNNQAKNNGVVAEEDDPFGDDEDNDLFMELDENLLITQALGDATTQIIHNNTTSSNLSSFQSSQQQTQQPKPPPKPVQPTFRPQPHKPPQQQQHQQQSSSFRVVAPHKPSSQPTIDLLDDDDDDFTVPDDEFDRLVASASQDLDAKPPEQKKPKHHIPIGPYQYIKVIKDNCRKFPNGHTVFIKACVSTIVSNIKVVEGNWTLAVILNDGSGFLEAKMTAGLLQKFIGFSPADMKRLKCSNDPTVKTRINNGLSSLSNSLVHMNGIFGIQIQRPSPIIVSFEELNSQHVHALKKRLQMIQ